MYYDRFGRSLTARVPQQPAPAPHATSTRLKSYLETHRTVWHTESLRELYPEIVGYLQSRYVAARRPGGVLVRSLDGAYPDVDFDYTDLRMVTDVLLSREYRRTLFDEHISPSIERLSA